MGSLNVISGPGETRRPLQYQRAREMWAAHCADEAAFGLAGVYANSRLADIAEANCILGPLEGARVEEALAYFAAQNVAPVAWYMPGASPAIAGLEEHLTEIWQLDMLAQKLPQAQPELTIIPARASFAHVAEIAAIMRPGVSPRQAAEAAMCHLDDSRVDALIALRDGRAAAYAAVLSAGEFGFIMEFFVREDLRRRGVGKTLAGRVMDICARSLFRNVYCPIGEGNRAGKSFLAQLGFSSVEKIGERQRS